MSGYRFSLQKYEGMKTRFTCPSCENAKRFTRYIDNETKTIIHKDVGRCDRVDGCGYHYPPRDFFKDNDIKIEQSNWGAAKILRKTSNCKTPSQINYSDVRKCISGLDKSSLVQFLYKKLGKEKTAPTLSNYLLGQFYYWDNINPVFWQIDVNDKVRTGKFMKYNSINGKRIRKPRRFINWMHTVLNYEDYNLVQCLYGEHLLNRYPQKVVGIVESEKTAIIASIFNDDFLWLATGGKSNMKSKMFEVLSERKVCLFPDINSYDEWCLRADELSSIIPDIKVSDLLEKEASEREREEGQDLADFLIRGII